MSDDEIFDKADDSEEEDEDYDKDDDQLQNRKRGRGDEEDDEEDDDLEEDEDDNQDDVVQSTKKGSKSKKPSSKSKKSKRADKLGIRSFFLTEAEDAGEDDDEEEESYDYERVESVEKEEKEAIEHVRRRQEIERKMNERSVEEIAAEVEARYRDQARYRVHYGETGIEEAEEYMTTEVSQKALLPDVRDPGIWMVRCRDNLEQSLVRSIMLKVIGLKKKGSVAQVTSVFCTSKGYIYVEAFTEPAARAVIQGLHGLYTSTFTRVPIQHMTNLLDIKVSKKPLQAGQLVRIKRGAYKGDLVKVHSVFDGGSSVVVKAMPRIDFLNAAANKRGQPKDGTRPPQRLFDAEEARAANQEVSRKKCPFLGEYCDFWNNDYYKDGFYYKEVQVATYIDTNGKKPSLEELQMFRELKDNRQNEDDDENSNEVNPMSSNTVGSLLKELAGLQTDLLLNSDKKTKVLPFRVGDMVQVVSGELKNLIGEVTNVEEASQVVRIRPKNEFTNTEQAVEASLLVKYIRTGSHVKVVNGTFSGQTGRVVSVNILDGDHVAAILTDGTQNEITCNVSHLQVSDEVTTGLSDLMGYELYDLVAVSQNELGVVIHVGIDKLKIMNHQGVIKQLLPQELQGKRNKQFQSQVAFDMNHQPLRAGNAVIVTENATTRNATIKHIFKTALWVHSNTWLKDSGISCVRSRSCQLAGNKIKTEHKAPGSGGMGAVGGRGGRGGAGRGGGGRNQRSDVVGKTVRITKGGFKGYLAHVIDVTDTHYSLELHTKLKKIVIEKSKAIVVGDRQGQVDESGGFSGNGSDMGIVSTPYFGGSTPFIGSETPAHFGGETPSHFAGDATPMADRSDNSVWRPNAADVRLLTKAGTAAGADEGGLETNMWSAPVGKSPSLEGEGWSRETASSNSGVGWSDSEPSEFGSGWGSDTTPAATGWESAAGPTATTPSSTSGWSNGEYQDQEDAIYSPAITQSNSRNRSNHPDRSSNSHNRSESQGNRPNSTSSTASYTLWDVGMVVCYKSGGRNMGKTGVIRRKAEEDGYFEVSLVDPFTGLAEGPSSKENHLDLQLAEPKRKDLVMVLTGSKTGMKGRVKAMKGNDVILENLDMLRTNQIACIIEVLPDAASTQNEGGNNWGSGW